MLLLCQTIWNLFSAKELDKEREGAGKNYGGSISDIYKQGLRVIQTGAVQIRQDRELGPAKRFRVGDRAPLRSAPLVGIQEGDRPHGQVLGLNILRFASGVDNLRDIETDDTYRKDHHDDDD